MVVAVGEVKSPRPRVHSSTARGLADAVILLAATYVAMFLLLLAVNVALVAKLRALIPRDGVAPSSDDFARQHD